jgi:hypothetical protein
MPMIRETIVTSVGAGGKVHIAPIGIITEGEDWIIAPFRPSTTLENLEAVPFAVANHTDDVRVFAGCLTGRRVWPTTPCAEVPVPRLASALSHVALAVTEVQADAVRPRFRCRVVGHGTHTPFAGFNRAQAAVIEAAILVSRLHMLPREKVEREIAYLAIAVSKTAGPHEQEAWRWLNERIESFYTAGSEGAG